MIEPQHQNSRSFAIKENKYALFWLPSTPNMKDVSLIAILGPFWSNQLIAALNTVSPEARTTFGCYRRHGASCYRFDVARGGNGIMALDYAGIKRS